MEGLIARIWKDVLGVEIPLPLRRMPYDEAMAQVRRRQAGPALRPPARATSPRPQRTAAAACRCSPARSSGERHRQGAARAGRGRRARSPQPRLDKLEDFAKASARKRPGVAQGRRRRRVDAGAAGQEHHARGARGGQRQASAPQPGDMLFFVRRQGQGGERGARRAAPAPRRQARPDRQERQWQFMWVTEFPLFEHDEDEQGCVAAHHPFTSPRAEDVALLESDPGKVRARAYDLVLNGNEIGGGSIRIHRARGAGPGVRGARPLRGGLPREVRLPARRVQVRPAAARRHRVRPRPPVRC